MNLLPQKERVASLVLCSKIAFVNILPQKERVASLVLCSKIAFVNILTLKIKSCFPCVYVLPQKENCICEFVNILN